MSQDQALEKIKDKYVDWVSEEFPKGDKGRGKAVVLVGMMLADFSEALKTATTEARGLIEELVDGGDCWYDHEGYCQGHSLHEKPCPHERAKAYLANLKGDSDE